MSISVHLISIPQEEVVTSRVIYLPESGGCFGRASSCDISLPDQSKRISRVHGHIKRTETGYVVKHTSQNRSMLNDKPLLRDKDYALNDGDILKVENYTILVSTLVSHSNTKSQPQQDTQKPQQSFTLDLQDEETDFLDADEIEVPTQPKSSFSKDHVLSDDPFETDPFNDIDKSQIEANIESPENQNNDPLDTVEPFAQDGADMEYFPVHNEAAKGTYLRESLDKLIHISEKNQQFIQNPQLQHEALFAALENTVEEFLDNFAPEQLEQQFNEYISGVFANKDKKYWRIYRKHFKHRLKNGDFQRQFKALFMENMQKQNKENQ